MKKAQKNQNAKAMQTELDEYDALLLKEAADQILLGLSMGLTSEMAEIEFQAAEEEEQLEREWHLRESFRQAQVEYRDALDEEEVKRMVQLKNDHQPRSNRKRAS